MRRGASFIQFALIVMFPPGTSAQIERPLWATDTELANFPVEIKSIVFPDATVWDGDHPSFTVGRWRISRSGPLIEYISTNLMADRACSSGTPGDCFYAYIQPLSCFNPADPTLIHCVMSLSWSTDRGARCALFVASSNTPTIDNPVVDNPRNITWFPTTCPREIHSVN